MDDRTQERDNFIRNICNYNPDGKSHQVKTIQIESRAEWLKLRLPPFMKPVYIRDSLNGLDTKLGIVRCDVPDVADVCETSANSKLLVSLLRFKDHYMPGIYNVIYIIHSYPHNESMDGYLHDGGPHQSDEPQFHLIQELFDEMEELS